MPALKELTQMLELANSNFGVLNLTPEQLHKIFSWMNDCDVDFSKFSIDKLCIVLYNAIQRIDNKNELFGDELVCAIRKIIDHFMDKQISREVALLFESIFKSLSPENLEVLVDEKLIQFIIKFMKSKGGGTSFSQKYCVIAILISVACPMWESAFLEHVDIPQLKHLVGDERNDFKTMFTIYHWISHISNKPCGIEFILKEPAYFTKILCELVKNAIEPNFFQLAVMALENLLGSENPVVQSIAQSELIGCVPNMTKHDFHRDLKERWDHIQKMF